MKTSNGTGSVVLVVAALYCGSALAGSMSATPVAIDKTNLPATAGTDLPTISVTLGAGLAYQDPLELTLEGGADFYVAFDNGAFNGQWSCGVGLLGFLNAPGNKAMFRVVSPPVDGVIAIPSGTTCTFSLQATTSSLAAPGTCAVSASFAAFSFPAYPGGAPIDAAGPVTLMTLTPCEPPVRIVDIDIRPGTMPNVVNRRSQGNLPVAILSDATFYAPTEVAISSLTFGRSGEEASLRRCNPVAEDVNADGLLDLKCHFDTAAASFQAGDTQGLLQGETIGGLAIAGTDSVRVVP